MQMIVATNGSLRCLYDEAIDLAAIGRLSITRASHVEPDEQGRWLADLRPSPARYSGHSFSVANALEAERAWLEAHWLSRWH